MQPKPIISLSKRTDRYLTPHGERVYNPPANIASIIFRVPKLRDVLNNPTFTSTGSEELPVPITLMLYQ